MKYLIVSDYFITELPLGGAEICNDVVIKLLTKRGHEIFTIKSSEVSPEYLESWDGEIVICSHQNLKEVTKNYLKSRSYIIYEHDFGNLALRDPSRYNNFIAPMSHRFNTSFYLNAKKIICQSDPHLEKFQINYDGNNLVSARSNPFLDSHLDYLEDMSYAKKNKDFCVLQHPFWQKATKEAIEICQKNNFKYEVLERLPNKEFLKELAKFKNLVFCPRVFETFSRVCAEACCLNLNILVNTNVSFAYTDYSKLRGIDLINHFRKNNQFIIQLFE